jgi:hypothetical protein
MQTTSYFKVEFNPKNVVRLLMNEPDKINVIIALAPLNGFNPFTAFMATFAIAFYNQVSIFGFEKGQSKIKLLVEIYIEDIEEDILCLDYDESRNQLAFGGKLGVGYIYNVGPPKKT